MERGVNEEKVARNASNASNARKKCHCEPAVAGVAIPVGIGDCFATTAMTIICLIYASFSFANTSVSSAGSGDSNVISLPVVG